MSWEVEFTDEFEQWWCSLAESEQDKVALAVKGLMDFGPNLEFPASSGIHGSKHRHMRELRIQYAGRPLRVLYAFNPERTAILLLGGDKTGNDRWYEVNLPLADQIYDRHLEELEAERKAAGARSREAQDG